MAEKRIAELRARLGWYFAFALGAALAFAVLVGVTAFVPGAGNNLLVWGTVFGFCMLVVLVFAAVSLRLKAMQAEHARRTSSLANTGQLLAEQVAARRKAEASLREEMLLPQMNPGPVVRFDAQGVVTRSNEAARELITGHSVDGRAIFDLLPGFTPEDLATVLRGDRLPPREVQWGKLWYICHLRGVPELATGLLYASDITTAKETQLELQRMEHRARAILEGAGEAIFIVIVNGIVQAANPAAQKMFGWKADDIVGGNVEMLLPDLFERRGGDRLWILAEHARRRHTGAIERTHFGRRKDGTRFPISLTVSVFDFDGNPRVSCIVRDISERVRANELEREQAAKLQEQNAELERLVTELNEFNYVASHDLQEPLRTMSTYCGLLRVDLGGDLPKRATEDVQAILDASLRMQRLIKDLLEYSRAGHRELHMKPVDLTEVMQRVASDLNSRVVETSGKIVFNGLPRAFGDEMQIGRVLQNLVANGLKFQKPGARPVVTVSGVEHGDQVVLEVQDNGIGIPAEYLGQLFMPFKRLHGLDKYEGSGIGLSVCRKIVERHGGSIDVKSTPGEGSRFTVKLPAAGAEVGA